MHNNGCRALPQFSSISRGGRVPIAGPRVSGSINLTGAVIDDLSLTSHTAELAKSSGPVRLFSPAGTPAQHFAQFGWVGEGAQFPDARTVWRAEGTRLTPQTAQQVATTLQALSTPSRLLILARLREGPLAATELAAEVGMEQSACSHQLRLLRNLGLVLGTRKGRSVVYSLYDNHVAELLDQALYHVEHQRLGLPDPAPEDPGR